MDLATMKYKDELPIKTINKVRDILGKLGLLTVETAWKNSVTGFYSVSVVVENTDLTTNGKGTSPEFALASAYGELMERLQNLANYRLSLDMRKEALEFQGFYYAPDEKALSIDELLDSKEEWITTQLSRVDANLDKHELLKLWLAISYEEVPADFIALPYFNLNTNNISHIPIKMVSKMYMSNGMCAGNTPEEALVQGISEILERNANKRILRERIVPPTIPRRYIARYPKIEAMIAGIEAGSDCEVIIKDCSLDKKFPVVGVVYINKSDQSYFVKFGAHPVFEIALERTLTELLQGQDIKRMMGVREFSYRSETDNPDNYMGILVTGSGVYPTEFFSRQSSYQFTEFEAVSLSDNKAMLAHMIAFLAKQGYQVYVRDVSFLGFPSFHVVIPGLSEIEELDEMRAITDYIEYNQFKKLVRELGQLSTDRVENLIGIMQKMHYSRDASIMDLINLPVRGNSFPWYYLSAELFLTALYYWKGDPVRAYETFDKFLSHAERTVTHRPVITYYKCVRDYLGTRINGLNDKEATNILGVFYPPDVVTGVIAEFNSPARILSYQGRMDCWNCDKCKFRNQCLYRPMERVYKIFKQQYAAAGIDQNKLKELL